MRRPYKGFPLAAACVLGIVLPAFSQECSPRVEVLPGKKLFPSFSADALAHQLSLSRVTDNREWIGAIGGSIPLLRLSFTEVQVQLNVGATSFSRLIKTPGHITVSTLDYKIDFPLDLRLHALNLRAVFGHMSSHYADDGIEQLGKQSISSVKDYVAMAASRDVEFIHGFVYLAAQYDYHNEPLADRHWMLQGGTEFGNLPLTEFTTIYGAIDCKLKEENAWGTTRSYQVGLKLWRTDDRGLRVTYTLRQGYEERGQLYDVSVTTNLVTLFIDF